MILTLIYILLNISLNNWRILIPIFLAYSWDYALQKWRQNDAMGILEDDAKMTPWAPMT